MPEECGPAERRQLLAALAERMRQGGDRCNQRVGLAEDERISSGCPALDGLLPGGGFARGTLIEWVGDEPGSGATTLALWLARAACGASGYLVVVDEAQTFFPPAAAALEIALERLLVARPETKADALWATDQALRSRGVAAVLAWPAALDHRTFRRWQLAAEQSRVLGLLIRPRAALAEPSWAEARLLVEPQPSDPLGRRWRLHLARARGGLAYQSLEVALHHDPGTDSSDESPHRLRLVSPLARATTVA